MKKYYFFSLPFLKKTNIKNGKNFNHFKCFLNTTTNEAIKINIDWLEIREQEKTSLRKYIPFTYEYECDIRIFYHSIKPGNQLWIKNNINFIYKAKTKLLAKLFFNFSIHKEAKDIASMELNRNKEKNNIIEITAKEYEELDFLASL